VIKNYEEKIEDQTCFGMHMPSRDGGDSGPNVRPRVIIYLNLFLFLFALYKIYTDKT